MRASDRTRVVEAMETPIPRMNECVSRPPMTRRRATRRSIDETRLARRGRSISTASNARARVVDSVSVARGVASTSRSIGHVVCRTAISKIIHECDASRASSHTSARGRPARGRRRAPVPRHRPAVVSAASLRVSRAREAATKGKNAMTQPIATSTWISSPTSRERRDGDDDDVVVLDADVDVDARARGDATRDGRDDDNAAPPRSGRGGGRRRWRYFRPTSIDAETSTSDGERGRGRGRGWIGGEKTSTRRGRTVVVGRRGRRAFDEIHRRVRWGSRLVRIRLVMTMSSIIRALNKGERDDRVADGNGEDSRVVVRGVGVAGKGVEGRVGVKSYQAWVEEHEKYEAARKRYEAAVKSETDRGRVRGGMGVERRAFSASAAREGSTRKFTCASETFRLVKSSRAQAHGVQKFRVVVATAHVSDE